MSDHIIERGRGPEIRGTRVTVYRIMDCLRAGDAPEQIASELDLSMDQVESALRYIDSHRSEVEAAYDEILARVNRPNPDWVEARLAKTPKELKRRLEALRQQPGNSEFLGRGPRFAGKRTSIDAYEVATRSGRERAPG